MRRGQALLKWRDIFNWEIKEISQLLCLSLNGIVIGRCIMKTLPCDRMMQAAVSILTISQSTGIIVGQLRIVSWALVHSIIVLVNKETGERLFIVHCCSGLILSHLDPVVDPSPWITSLHIFDNDGHDQTSNNYRVNHRGFLLTTTKIPPPSCSNMNSQNEFSSCKHILQPDLILIWNDKLLFRQSVTNLSCAVATSQMPVLGFL